MIQSDRSSLTSSYVYIYISLFNLKQWINSDDKFCTPFRSYNNKYFLRCPLRINSDPLKILTLNIQSIYTFVCFKRKISTREIFIRTFHI